MIPVTAAMAVPQVKALKPQRRAAGERRMVEEKMTRLDIEDARSGEVDVRPADEDDRRCDPDQRGNPGELERGLVT